MDCRRCFTFALAGLLTLTAAAKELKLLTIGNSFADSAFVFLPKVAESAGDSVRMERANIGGCPLKKHWMLAEQNAKPYSGKRSLREKLTADTWDIVTIQQASHDSWNPETYTPYAENLQKLVKELAPQAELLIQQTWAYRFDDGRLHAWKFSQKVMHERLTDAYKAVAAKLGIRMIPTGNAVALARETQPVPYVPYDPAALKNLTYPAPLPSEAGSFVPGNRWEKVWLLCGQSLNWRQKNALVKKGSPIPEDDVRKLAEQPEPLTAKQKAAVKAAKPGTPLFTREWRIVADRSHLNRRGQYLQALVWYATLFDRPVRAVTYRPDDIPEDDAQFLKSIAQKVVDEQKKSR